MRQISAFKMFSSLQRQIDTMTASFSRHPTIRVDRRFYRHTPAFSLAQDNTPNKALRNKKRRLDEVCMDLHPQYSRNILQSWIAQGKVFVNGRQTLKAGSPVPEDAKILVNAQVPKFVCRAGLKLEKALEVFDLTVTGKRALDSGLSTGGFTDCLLKAGAASVVGVDVGYGQVAQAIRIDPRVTVMERTNLRRLRRSDLPFEDGGPVDIVTLDLSFISLLKVLEAVDNVLSVDGDIIALVKPQFEAGKANVAAGGVVKDPEVREATVQAVIEGFRVAGFVCLGTVESPIRGATAGNIEYLCHFKRRKLEQQQQQQQQQGDV